MIKKIFSTHLSGAFPVILPFFVSVFAVVTLYKCNPSYENKPSGLTGDIHNAVAPLSMRMHAENFRFPFGNCDQDQCHGADLNGGSTGGISCLSCHDNQWSVFSDGTHTQVIGGYYHHKDAGNNLSCTLCHGSNLQGVDNYNFRYSCYACHDPIPVANHAVLPPFSTVKHAFNYRFPLSTGTEKCTQCHGTGLSGGTSGQPSCYSCHTDVWSLFSSTHTVNRNNYYHHTNIGNSGINDTFSVCATANCHGASLAGGTGTGSYRHSCTTSTCHSRIPAPFHTRGRDGVMHKTSGTCEISYCHGSSHQLGRSCSTSGCHD